MLIANYIRRIVWKLQAYALLGGVFILLLEAALKLVTAVTQGMYPPSMLYRLLAYKIPSLCGILFPFSVATSLLLTGNFLRQSRQLIALHSLGVSFSSFRSLLLQSQLPIGLLALLNSLLFQPWSASLEKQFLIQQAASLVPFSQVVGKIQTLPNQAGILFIAAQDGEAFSEVVLLWRPSELQIPILLVADQAAWIPTTAYNNVHIFQLKNAHWYRLDLLGIPQLSGFTKTLDIRMPKPTALAPKEGLETTNSWELFRLPSSVETRTEAYMRIASPLSVYLFALLSLPLAQNLRTKKRHAVSILGLFIALLLYLTLKSVASALSLEHRYDPNYTFGILHGGYFLAACWSAYPYRRRSNRLFKKRLQD